MSTTRGHGGWRPRRRTLWRMSPLVRALLVWVLLLVACLAAFVALALGLGAFVGYLGLNDLGREAITGVLMIASAILVVRVIGALADRGWSERYNRLAVPTETGFVVALGAVLFFG